MLRGEIRLVDLGQVLPSESASQRPAVIVSNDGANSTAARLGRGVVTVAPMTSNIPPGVSVPSLDSSARRWARKGLEGAGGAGSSRFRGEGGESSRFRAGATDAERRRSAETAPVALEKRRIDSDEAPVHPVPVRRQTGGLGKTPHSQVLHHDANM